MQDFREAFTPCSLEDMGYIGDPSTWRRGRIRERLDRSTINSDWAEMFSDAVHTNGEMTKSEHRPFLIDMEHHAMAARTGVQDVVEDSINRLQGLPGNETLM